MTHSIERATHPTPCPRCPVRVELEAEVERLKRLLDQRGRDAADAEDEVERLRELQATPSSSKDLETACGYCGKTFGHSHRCSVARHEAPELRVTTCPTCGSSVRVVSSDEGTNFFAPVKGIKKP